MRPRFLIGLSIFALIAIAILFWFRQARQTAPVKLVTEPQPMQRTSLASQPTIITTNANGPTVSIPTAADIATISNKAAKARELQWQRGADEMNSPVNFYGQFVDQDGNPLSGVKVNVEIRHWYLVMPEVLGEKPARPERTSDLGGRFEIHGETGDALSIISVQKDGYETEPNMRHGFGASSGSLQSPEIIRLWKTNIHEQLITGGNKFQIVPDGRPYFINLTDGTISESGSGDLKVWIQYTNQVVRGQLYDWSTEIDVINGGLLEETDPYSSMFSVPKDDYQPSFLLQQQIKGGQRGSIGERRFYLKLKSGQEYGRMSIELHAPFNNQIPGLINLSYAINPSGSRILR